ncbi:MAG: hypothetical protein RLZZ179_1002 [Verrucomicrobiota bacterium]|jgi:hypothetical protein
MRIYARLISMFAVLFPQGAPRRFAAAVLVPLVVLVWLAERDWKSGSAEKRVVAARAEGTVASTRDYVVYWIPRAATAGAAAALTLLLASRWLGRPLPPGDAVSVESVAGSNRLLWQVTFAAVLYSGVMNARRLDLSLWGDEDATVRKSVVGQYVRDAADDLRFREVTWFEAAFRYRDPNNHPLNSLLAKASHAALARAPDEARGFYFDERALRLPVFAAGLLALPALAWLCRALGRPQLGMVAVLLMSLHPWFVRYASEARGYGLLLLFVPLTLGSLLRAALRGSWPWWLSFSGGQFVIMWSFPGSVLLLAALNLAAVGLIWTAGPAAWRRMQTGRWLVASVTGAVLCALLLLPCAEPLLLYLKSARMQGPMPASWYGDALSWITTGMPWHAWDAGSPLCFAWETRLAERPLLWWPAALLLFSLPVAGVCWWWSEGKMGRALLPALLLFPLLILAQAAVTGGFFCSWYTLPGFPGWMLLSSGGILWLARGRKAVATALLAAVGVIMAPASTGLRQFPIEAMREGTELTRSITQPSHPGIDEVITLAVLMNTQAYDPAAWELEDDPAQLRRWLDTADDSGVPLFIHLGSPHMARELKPGIMEIIEDPGVFSLLRIYPGHDAPYERRVYRYLGNRAGQAAREIHRED